MYKQHLDMLQNENNYLFLPIWTRWNVIFLKLLIVFFFSSEQS